MWTKELFKVEKPIIALLHLRALPGDPLFGGSMNAVIEKAREELNALQDGGVDGILIANEFSLPYEKRYPMLQWQLWDELWESCQGISKFPLA